MLIVHFKTFKQASPLNWCSETGHDESSDGETCRYWSGHGGYFYHKVAAEYFLSRRSRL